MIDSDRFDFMNKTTNTRIGVVRFARELGELEAKARGDKDIWQRAYGSLLEEAEGLWGSWFADSVKQAHEEGITLGKRKSA